MVIVLILGKLLGTCTHLLRLETISNWFFVSFAKKFTIRSSTFSLHFVLRTLRTLIWTEPFLLHLTLVFRTYKTSVNTEKFDLLQISHSSWNIQNRKKLANHMHICSNAFSKKSCVKMAKRKRVTYEYFCRPKKKNSLLCVHVWFFLFENFEFHD